MSGNSREQLIAEFRKDRLVTKEDILAAAGRLGGYWDKQACKYSQSYCDHAKRLTDEFKEIVTKHDLFPAPAGCWSYAVVVRGGGIYLVLEHFEVYKGGLGNELIEERRDWYELLGARARLLTAEEYAQMNDLEHPAAVTRIRRGKIRSAVKVGKQWRIPEMAEPIERGYKSAEYDWIGKLSGVPLQYKIIEDYNHASFFQDESELSLYHIRFTGENIEPMEFTCDRRQRGRLEQVLIAHPYIRCLSDEIVRIDKKHEITTSCRED